LKMLAFLKVSQTRYHKSGALAGKLAREN
jgi:hypothetical protein